MECLGRGRPIPPKWVCGFGGCWLVLLPMRDESMLQALESTADQMDRLAEIIDEFLTMAEAGVPMSATTRQKYAAEMAELRGQRARLRERIADFWVQIGQNAAQ